MFHWSLMVGVKWLRNAFWTTTADTHCWRPHGGATQFGICRDSQVWSNWQMARGLICYVLSRHFQYVAFYFHWSQDGWKRNHCEIKMRSQTGPWVNLLPLIWNIEYRTPPMSTGTKEIIFFKNKLIEYEPFSPPVWQHCTLLRAFHHENVFKTISFMNHKHITITQALYITFSFI